MTARYDRYRRTSSAKSLLDGRWVGFDHLLDLQIHSDRRDACMSSGALAFIQWLSLAGAPFF